jgi:small subunit ribosomal protein S18
MRTNTQKELRIRKRVCNFCKEEKEPDFKDIETLKKFLTERGKIVSRAKSGVCARHQRALSIAIKRARTLVLVPYSPRV